MPADTATAAQTAAQTVESSSRQSLWMILAAFAFSAMGVCVKLASAHYSTGEIVFYRSVIGYYNNTFKLPAGLEFDYQRYQDWVTNK